MGEVFYGRSHIGFNGFGINPMKVVGVFELTNSFNKDITGIIVPKAGYEPTVTNLARTLNTESWLATILSIFLITFVVKLLQWARHLISEGYPMKHVSILMYQSFIGDSIGNKVPTAYSMRCLFVFWFFYSYLMTSAFTGQLKSTLVQPKPLNDIDNLEELAESPLKIITFNETYEIVESYFGPALLPRFNRSLIITSFHNFSRQFPEHPDKAHIATENILTEAISKTFNSTIGRPTFHKMREYLSAIPMVYHGGLGSPFLHRINELMGQFHQAGLMVYWMDETLYDMALDGRFEEQKCDEEILDKEKDGVNNGTSN